MPTLFEHPIGSVESFEVPGAEHPFIRLRMPDWCNVVALTSDQQLVLVRQHRWGIDAPTLEIPGGVIDPGEQPLQAAQRELLEETGYGEGQWTALGRVSSNPAIQTNYTWLFLARGVRPVAPPRPDPTENITIEHHPLAKLHSLLDSGAIDHAYAVVSLQRVLLSLYRQPEQP